MQRQLLAAGFHCFNVLAYFVGVIEHDFSRRLSERRHRVVNTHFHHHRQHVRLGNCVANTHPGQAVGLGERTQANHARQRLAKELAARVVTKIAVGLV